MNLVNRYLFLKDLRKDCGIIKFVTHYTARYIILPHKDINIQNVYHDDHLIPRGMYIVDRKSGAIRLSDRYDIDYQDKLTIHYTREG